MLISKNTIREMYRVPFIRKYGHIPQLTNVDYPKVMVSEAFYNNEKRQTIFTLLPSDDKFIEKTSFKVENLSSFVSISKNGKPLVDGVRYDQTNKVLLVTTSLNGDETFVVQS